MESTAGRGGSSSRTKIAPQHVETAKKRGKGWGGGGGGGCVRSFRGGGWALGNVPN